MMETPLFRFGLQANPETRAFLLRGIQSYPQEINAKTPKIVARGVGVWYNFRQEKPWFNKTTAKRE